MVPGAGHLIVADRTWRGRRCGKALRPRSVPRWLMVTKWCDLRVLRVHPARSGRRFVGWAKRSVPTIQDKLDDRGWARCALPTLRTANRFAWRASAIAMRNRDKSTRRQITSDFPKSCQAQESKIFRLTCRANHLHNSACLTADEGRWPSSRTRGEMRWTLMAR